MLSRLLEAHEMIIVGAHDAAARTAKMGDDGTNDLLVSDVIRTGELQAWFRTDADCLDYLDWLRWPGGFACPSCGHAGAGGWAMAGMSARGASGGPR